MVVVSSQMNFCVDQCYVENYNVECVMRECGNCKEKVINMNDIKCSKECYQKNINCYEEGHVVQFKQFERMEYEHARQNQKETDTC